MSNVGEMKLDVIFLFFTAFFHTGSSSEVHDHNGTLLRRTKRQGLLCAGSKFVNEVLTAIFDRNREHLRKVEPNRLGTCQHFALFRLCDFRAWGLSRARFPEPIQAVCDESGYWAEFNVVVALQDITVFADVTFPLSLAGCILKGQARLLAARVIAHWPTNKPATGFTPKVTDVTMMANDGLKFDIIGGSYPLGPGLKLMFSLLLAVAPYAVDRLFANILRTAFQQWIDGYHDELPF